MHRDRVTGKAVTSPLDIRENFLPANLTTRLTKVPRTFQMRVKLIIGDVHFILSHSIRLFDKMFPLIAAEEAMESLSVDLGTNPEDLIARYMA